jgi:hypothetical protein
VLGSDLFSECDPGEPATKQEWSCDFSYLAEMSSTVRKELWVHRWSSWSPQFLSAPSSLSANSPQRMKIKSFIPRSDDFKLHFNVSYISLHIDIKEKKTT